MDTHTLNKTQVQEDESIIVLQYLWEQFRDEVDPFSSAERTHVDNDDLSLNMPNKSNMSFKILSQWELSYSYLLPDIRTMSQGRTATKNKHLPPDLLHLSSNSHSLTQCDSFLWIWHLGLLLFAWHALTTLRGKKKKSTLTLTYQLFFIYLCYCICMKYIINNYLNNFNNK